MYDLPPRRRISLILVKLGPAHCTFQHTCSAGRNFVSHIHKPLLLLLLHFRVLQQLHTRWRLPFALVLFLERLCVFFCPLRKQTHTVSNRIHMNERRVVATQREAAIRSRTFSRKLWCAPPSAIQTNTFVYCAHSKILLDMCGSE